MHTNIHTDDAFMHTYTGSIVTKLALKWSKEAGMSSGNEAHEEAEADPNYVHIADINKCVILGTTGH